MSPESRPFKNSNLFSNHYLEKLVKESPKWRQEAGLAEAFAKIEELYEHKARGSTGCTGPHGRGDSDY